MSNKKAAQKTEKELEKQRRTIRRLYTLVWFLACPLAYVVARLLGYGQINIVYWTLLVVPLLLAIINVRQLPPVAVKPVSLPQPEGKFPEEDRPDPAEEPEEPEKEEEPPQAVSRSRWMGLLLRALKAPAIIAFPILVTLIVDIIIRSAA